MCVCERVLFDVSFAVQFAFATTVSHYFHTQTYVHR